MLQLTVLLAGMLDASAKGPAIPHPAGAGQTSPTAEQWLGWRGLDRQGRSNAPTGPLHWSAQENIRWKTAIPGLGHSSPIVTDQSVYVTTAYHDEGGVLSRSTMALLEYGCVLLSTVLLVGFLGWRCAVAEDLTRTRLTRLTVLMLLTGAIGGIVMLGENLFNFERCEIRAWIASSFCVSLCLILCGVTQLDCGRRTRTWALVLLGWGVFVCLAAPCKDHAFRGSVLSHSSTVMLILGGCPLTAGLFFLLPHHRPPASTIPMPAQAANGARHRRKKRILGWLGVICGLACLAGIGRVMAGHPMIEHYSPAESAHVPVLTGPLLWADGAIFCLCAFGWFSRRRRFATNMLIIAGAALSGLIILVAVAEQVIARSSYLTYHLGVPRFQTLLGAWSLWVWLGVAVLAALGVLLKRNWLARVPGNITLMALQISIILLATVYSVQTNYLSRKVAFVRAVACLDRHSGAVRWICTGLPGPRGKCHRDNSAATPTPVTDGRRIFAYFGSAGAMCVSADGQKLWTSRELPYENAYGVATSPLLCDDRIIVSSESRLGAYLAALDLQTGQVLWKIDRQTELLHSGNNRTPVLKTIAGQPTILIWSAEQLCGYHPEDGRRLWRQAVAPVGGDQVAGIVSDRERLYLADMKLVQALDQRQLGNGPDAHVWQRKLRGPNCASPLLVNGLLYLVSDNGVAHCLDARTGAVLWQQRLKGRYYSSPVALGGNVYFCNLKGATTVISAGRVYHELRINDLGEPIHASGAAVDGLLFLRTKNHVFCF